MRNVFVFVSILIFSLGYTQTEEGDGTKKVAPKDFQDRFYLGLVSSYYIDFATTPLSSSTVYIGEIVDPNDPSKTIPNYGQVPSQTTYNSFFSIGLEPRFNIKDFTDNLAFGVAVPLTIGFGQVFPASANVSGAINGFGSLQIPVLAKIYLGTASTYASNEDFGLSAGLGFEFNKIGLINPGASPEEQNALRPWVMPTASAAVHFWRGNTPMEVNVKYGFGALQSYQTNQFGQALPTGSRNTRASSIKLTFVYLMNY